MSRISIVIPSRLAAHRLPNKPLHMIKGEPMVVHVMRRAMEANVGSVFVACCGEKIARIIRSAGGQAIITDPSLPSGTDRIWAATRDNLHDTDIIVNLQGDLPFVRPETIKSAAQVLVDHPTDDIGTVSYIDKAHNDPSHVKIALAMRNERDGRALYFSRSCIPHGTQTIDHHIGIYSFRRKALETFCSLPPHALELSEKLEQLRALAHGMQIGVRRVDDQPRSVDTLDDALALQ